LIRGFFTMTLLIGCQFLQAAAGVACVAVRQVVGHHVDSDANQHQKHGGQETPIMMSAFPVRTRVAMNMVIVPFMRMVALFIVVHWFPVFSIASRPILDGVVATSIDPLPVSNLRQILAVRVDVVFVPDEFVRHLLLQIVAPSTQVRQAIDHVLHQMKPIQIVLHSHVESGRDSCPLPCIREHAGCGWSGGRSIGGSARDIRGSRR